MSPKSQDSEFDQDRFEARTQHIVWDSSPEGPAHRRAETDFAAVGSAFWGPTESDSRPNSLEISEGEEIPRDAEQMRERAELCSDANAMLAGDVMSRRSPATPTPTQPNYGSYIQPSDITQFREARGRRTRRPRRPRRGMYSFRHEKPLCGCCVAVYSNALCASTLPSPSASALKSVLPCLRLTRQMLPLRCATAI